MFLVWKFYRDMIAYIDVTCIHQQSYQQTSERAFVIWSPETFKLYFALLIIL